MTVLIGDIHGLVHNWADITKNHEKTIQLGDFGMGFLHEDKKAIAKNILSENHRFIRGNHDSPEICRETPGWIPDGTVEGDLMFIGGAWSIDQARRIPGVSWWEDEEVSQRELNDLVYKYNDAQPRIMITHDCPTQIGFDNHLKYRPWSKQYMTRTADAFQQMFHLHQPEFWFYGHWHESRQLDVDGTRFVCLTELETFDIGNI